MKKNKNVILVVSTILLTMFYFTYSVTITWDSAHYMSYVNILEKSLPFSNWDVVRGPVFPIIIYLSNFLFGKTVQGLLINSYIYYLLMLFFSYKILNEILPKNNKKYKIILISLLAIILNPIIYGYYHVLLTEFIAMSLSVLSCYLAYKWIDCNFTNKKKFILYLILFTFLTIITWFLKQPYVSVGIFPIFIAFIIRMFNKEKIKKKLSLIITLLFCLVSLVTSIGIWNHILESKGLDSNSKRNPTASLGNTFISAIKYFEINKCEENCDTNLKYLSNEEKKLYQYHLENNDNTYIIINIYNKNDKLINREFIDLDSENIPTTTALIVIFENFFSHPLLIIDSYLSNYLAISNVYATTNENSDNYKVIKKIDLDFVNEISSIGLKPYSYTSNIFYINDEAYQRVINYEQFNHAPKLLNYTMLILGKISIILFKLLFVFLPFVFLISLIQRIRTKEKKYNMLIILFGYGLLHMILHTVTGAIIDRYAMPAYITTFLGIIILINLLNKKEVKKNEK